MRAVIMAGGEGTRIRSIAGTHPKSMVRIEGKPVLWYQLNNLARSGIREVTLVTGFLGDEIREYFGNGESLGLLISYLVEPYPLGTGGALAMLDASPDEDFLLMMGDLMMSVDLKRFIRAHRLSGGLITLLVHPNSHPYDSDIIVTDEVDDIDDFTEERLGIDIAEEPDVTPSARLVTGFIGKKDVRAGYYHNLVNSGIYMISGKVAKLTAMPEKGNKTDLDRDIVRPLIAKGEVYAYRSTEYIKDMGTPERFDEAEKQLRAGAVEKRNLLNPQSAVFLDRDGTINVFKGIISDPKEIELLPDAAEAVRRLNASGYLAVLVTNQPVLSRGDVDFKGYDEIEQALETALGKEGAYLDAAYYCPHHPDKGFEGEVCKLKFVCRCRKPEPGLLLRAKAIHHIDLESSFMVGDFTSDILAGKRAGVRTIGLRTGGALTDGKYEVEPLFMADDLMAAVDIILEVTIEKSPEDGGLCFTLYEQGSAAARLSLYAMGETREGKEIYELSDAAKLSAHHLKLLLNEARDELKKSGKDFILRLLIHEEDISAETLKSLSAVHDHDELLMVKYLSDKEEPKGEDIDINISTENVTEDGESFIRGDVSTAGSEMGFRAYASQASLYGVLTYDKYLRKGYARKMISGVCAYLRDMGISEALIHVSDDNLPAYGLYKALDFKERERLKVYYLE